MKFEKRGDAEVDITPAAPPADAPKDAPAAPTTPANTANPNRSVLRYLIILFAIAFILIIFSFVMHQRSNAEVLSQLQSSVDTIERLQQVEVDYENLQDDYDKLELENKQLTEEAEKSDKENQAICLLWKAEKLLAAENYDDCAAVLDSLKKDDLYLSLPAAAEDEDESPLSAYERILAAVSNN